MNKQKIAVIADSGSDVPKEWIEKSYVKTLPLSITFSEGTYLDKVDITEDEVYDRLPTEIPKTSLPKPEYAHNVFEEIIEEGYEKVIAITISSGLSGTYNSLRLTAQEYPELESYIVDTKNIGIGSGLTALYMLEEIENGKTYEEITSKIPEIIENTDVFFRIPTLKYLSAGGRIGKVTSLVGGVMNINPIISCNEEGVYYTVAKTRGRKRSMKKMKKIVREMAEKQQKVNLAVAYGGRNVKELATQIKTDLEESILGIQNIYFGTVSPALGVHTGPDLIGIGIQTVID